MRRREFIAALGGAAAWPMLAGAQEQKQLVVYLVFTAAQDTIDRFPAFLRGLNEVVDSRQIVIERPRLTTPDERSALIADLLRRKPAVIYAGDLGTAIALKKETSAVPIVVTSANDPTTVGLAASMSHPGGNVTGNRLRAGDEPLKLLELLHDLIPAATTFGFLINPSADIFAEGEAAVVEAAARAIGVRIVTARVNDEKELPEIFSTLASADLAGVIVNESRYLAVYRKEVTALALRYSLPIIGSSREFAIVGGLASFGSDINDGFRQGGVYVGRILKGEMPADLPILQPTKFDLVINLKTAKALGLDVPPMLLARANEVIE